MLLKRNRKLFKFLNKSFRHRERTALNLAVDLGNSDAELLLEIVASLCLTLVVGDIILAKDIGSDGFLDIVDADSREVRLVRTLRPDEHVNVRMPFRVMIGGIPPKIPRRDVHLPCDIIAVRAQERDPLAGLIIGKSFGILALQRENQPPDIPRMSVHFLLDFRENNVVTVIGKESVRASTLVGVAHHSTAREYFYSLTRGNIVGITAAGFACRRFRSRLIIRRF